MANEVVNRVIVSAVQRAYESWAAEHPSLADVIDRITLTERAAESLRDSEQYRQAVEAYHASSSEMELLNKLVDLAGPVIRSILGG